MSDEQAEQPLDRRQFIDEQGDLYEEVPAEQAMSLLIDRMYGIETESAPIVIVKRSRISSEG